MTDDEPARVINAYFSAALTQAGSWRGSTEQLEDIRKIHHRWLAEHELDSLTATQALLWATNRALTAAPDDLRTAAADQRTLANWLADRTHHPPRHPPQ